MTRPPPTPHASAPGHGRVFWITGLPGSGKTTVGRLLATSLRAARASTVLLDGDVLRDAFEHDLGYSVEDRRRWARRYARLSRMLAEQGLEVVVATVSMFEEVRRWNREHLPRYIEVYLRAPLEVRVGRDRRALYGASEVVGVDVPWEEPVTPDLVIDNDGSLPPEEIVARIWQRAGPMGGEGR